MTVLPAGRRVGIYELTTPDLRFEEDVRLYAELGVGGIGVCEVKLPQGCDDESVARLRDSGLTVTACLPSVDSILPQPLVAGARVPAERTRALCESITRLARFDPATVICTTGPAGDLGTSEARSVVIDGLRTAAAVASDVGVKLAVEPIHELFARDWSMVTGLVDTLDLVDEVGTDAIGVMVDSWHLWNTPDFAETIAANVDRIFGVHISDWRDVPQSWCDRVLPGDGVIDLKSFVGALETAGYRGFYDLEILSDDGRYGVSLPDSLWRLDPAELVTRAYDSFCQAIG